MNRNALNLMLDGIDRATGTAGTLHRVMRDLQHVYFRSLNADSAEAKELLERAEALAKLLAADIYQTRISFERTYNEKSEAKA